MTETVQSEIDVRSRSIPGATKLKLSSFYAKQRRATYFHSLRGHQDPEDAGASADGNAIGERFAACPRRK
jgi:hypothetical protein